MLNKKNKEARVIFVANRETGEKINLYGWVKEDKETKTSVQYYISYHTEVFISMKNIIY